MRRLILLLGFAALAALSFVCVSGCATNTGNPSKDRAARVTNATLQAVGDSVAAFAGDTLLAMAMQEASGKGIDMASAASQGLWTAAPSIINPADIANIINAWSGNTLPAVASQAADQFAAAAPKTPADRIAVTNAIAAAISRSAISASDALP